MDKEKIKEAIVKATSGTKQRKFVQTLDMSVNFKDIDFNKPENRMDLSLALPNGRGKNIKICVIADKELVKDAKECADMVLTKEDVDELAKNKDKAKKLAEDITYFIAQANLMPIVGKSLGQVLAPRGKMPTPVPGTVKLAPVVEKLRKTIRLKNRGKFLPTLHAAIGTEAMDTDKLTENAMLVLNSITEKLQKGRMGSVAFKLTMGPCVKVVL
jgi:large subunit ribosomal protein L1